MTKAEIDTVLDRVRAWPADRQQLAVDILLAIESRDSDIYELTPEEEADLKEAFVEADGGEFVSDEEMKAFFDRFR
jgi:hypothetical protein